MIGSRRAAPMVDGGRRGRPVTCQPTARSSAEKDCWQCGPYLSVSKPDTLITAHQWRDDGYYRLLNYLQKPAALWRKHCGAEPTS
jgi:hypothetical protein